jgi:hypothetical protein
MAQVIPRQLKFNADSKDISYYWESNSKEKILRRIQEILNDR